MDNTKSKRPDFDKKAYYQLGKRIEPSTKGYMKRKGIKIALLGNGGKYEGNRKVDFAKERNYETYRRINKILGNI